MKQDKDMPAQEWAVLYVGELGAHHVRVEEGEDKALKAAVTPPGSGKEKIVSADTPIELEHELVNHGLLSEAHARQLVERLLLQ